jgi:hypothetical protein
MEEHCSSSPERFDKMLILMSNIETIGLEMAREVEIQRAQSTEDFDEEFLQKLAL